MTNQKQLNKQKLADKSRAISEFRKRLWEAVEIEDYKVAAKLRDQIQHHQNDLIKFLVSL